MYLIRFPLFGYLFWYISQISFIRLQDSKSINKCVDYSNKSFRKFFFALQSYKKNYYESSDGSKLSWSEMFRTIKIYQWDSWVVLNAHKLAVQFVWIYNFADHWYKYNDQLILLYIMSTLPEGQWVADHCLRFRGNDLYSPEISRNDISIHFKSNSIHISHVDECFFLMNKIRKG